MGHKMGYGMAKGHICSTKSSNHRASRENLTICRNIFVVLVGPTNLCSRSICT